MRSVVRKSIFSIINSPWKAKAYYSKRQKQAVSSLALIKYFIVRKCKSHVQALFLHELTHLFGGKSTEKVDHNLVSDEKLP